MSPHGSYHEADFYGVLGVSLNIRSDGSWDRGPRVALRCLIVDDTPSFREAMRALLEAQAIDAVAGAGSADEARQRIAELRPDVALIDIDLGGDSGLALARSLRDGATDAVPKVILISTHDESEFADLIEATPAVGFLSKTELSAAHRARPSRRSANSECDSGQCAGEDLGGQDV